MKYFYLLFLLFTTLTLSSQVVQITQTHTIEVTGQLQEYILTGLLPQNVKDKQRIIGMQFYPKEPILFTEDGADYFRFIFDGSDKISQQYKIEIKIEYDIELFGYDLSRAKIYPTNVADTFNLDHYLRKEPYERLSEKRLAKIKAEIGPSDNELELVEKLFSYVLEKLEYSLGISQNIGAARALRKGKGDCTEYSDLFVTLCRYYNIPAKIVSGTVVRRSKNTNHNWVEVYLKDYGWVPFDPTFADHPKSRSSFNTLASSYVYKSWNRVDPYRSSAALRHEYKWHVPGSMKFHSYYDWSSSKIKAMGKVGKHYNNHEYDTALSILNELIIFDSKNTTYLTFKGMIFARLGHIDEARVLFQLAIRNAFHVNQMRSTYYSYANYLALIGEFETSLTFLKGAFDLGFRNFDHVMIDEDLEELRKTEGFAELMKAYQD